MKVADDYYLKKSRALKEAEAKWIFIRGLANTVWLLVVAAPLIWLMTQDASATSYVILGLTWLFFRWITLKMLAYEYVVKAVDKIEQDYPRDRKPSNEQQ